MSSSSNDPFTNLDRWLTQSHVETLREKLPTTYETLVKPRIIDIKPGDWEGALKVTDDLLETQKELRNNGLEDIVAVNYDILYAILKQPTRTPDGKFTIVGNEVSAIDHPDLDGLDITFGRSPTSPKISIRRDNNMPKGEPWVKVNPTRDSRDVREFPPGNLEEAVKEIREKVLPRIEKP